MSSSTPPRPAPRKACKQFDTLISKPTLADELAQRKETQAILTGLKAAAATEPDKDVREDLAIIDANFAHDFRQQDYAMAHEVPFINASQLVFRGLYTLLSDQVPDERSPAAVIRLRKYTGAEPGFTPITDLLKQRVIEQMAKPGVIYPSRGEMETELGRNKNYVDGIAALFTKYKLTGWEEPYAKLKQQLADYDAWTRATVLPKARTDFRLQPERVRPRPRRLWRRPPALRSRRAGPRRLYSRSRARWLRSPPRSRSSTASLQPTTATSSASSRRPRSPATPSFPSTRIASKSSRASSPTSNWSLCQAVPLSSASPPPRRQPRSPPPTCSPRPSSTTPASAASSSSPIPSPPPPAAQADKYDDFAYDAVSWTLISHEARPGHELQFDSMVEQGVSLARALYAFNSTNVEGWGLYSEWIMQPYEPAEGQLLTLQLRLLRAARAFLDPELQAGKVTPEGAYKVLEGDVILSHAFAQEEVERFTYRMPGQANSYFYGYTKLLALRKDTEAALGPRFNAKRFHDFLLAQGLLPPNLLRQAVMENFVPREKAVH